MRARFFASNSSWSAIVALTIALCVESGCSNLRVTPPPPAELVVRATATGMSSVQTEAEVTRTLEHIVMQTPGLTQLRGRTSGEQTELRLTFSATTNLDEAAHAVRERLSKDMPQLPPSIVPVIERPRDLVIYRYTVDSDQLPSSELHTLHERKIRRQLEMLPGVGGIESCGGSPPRVEIVEDLQRLLSLELTPGELSRAVRDAMLGPASLVVRSTIRLSDLQNLPIGQRAGAPLRLGDVATIRQGARPPSCLAGRDRQSRVIFGQVFAQLRADVQSVQAAIDSRMFQLASELPASVHVKSFAFTASKPLSRRESWLKTLRGASELKPRLLHVRLHPAGGQVVADGSLEAALRKLAFELPSVESAVTQVHLNEDLTKKQSAFEVELLLALPIPEQDHLPGAALPPIIDALLAGVAKLPGAPFEVELRAADALGAWPAARPPIPVGLRVCGPELSQLSQVAQRLRTALSNVPAARMLHIDGASQRASQRVQIDRQALALHGINIAEVAQTLTAVLAGEKLGSIFDGEEQLDVVARVGETPAPEAMLDVLKLKSRGGAWIPLRALASITADSEPSVILRESGQRCVLLRMTAMTNDSQALIRQSEAPVRSVQLPPGVVVNWIPNLTP